eukprot:GHVU01097569.1.p2 GENE.GHVU01097569.1~~GHVU01097569.1.p2  ORF type:complete len:101 (-),score=4.97 GHVU01097569.1:50-352(-)
MPSPAFQHPPPLPASTYLPDLHAGVQYLAYLLIVLVPTMYPVFTWYGGTICVLFHIFFLCLLVAFTQVGELVSAGVSERASEGRSEMGCEFRVARRRIFY